MSSRTQTAAKRANKRNKRKRRRERKIEAKAEAVEQHIEAEGGKSIIPSSRARIIARSASRNANTVGRLEKAFSTKLAIAEEGQARQKVFNISRSSARATSQFALLTQAWTPKMKSMLLDSISTKVDIQTNVIEQGREPRLPDAVSLPSGIITSKKVIPINVMWTEDNINSGKFSVGCRPILGSFHNFAWAQDYYIGEKGWPDGVNTTFTSQELYSTQTSTSSKWPLAYDPNYPLLSQSLAQSGTMIGVRNIATSSYTPNNSLTLSTPLGTDFGGLNGVLPIQTTPGLNMVVTAQEDTANIVSLPPGTWQVSGFHRYNAGVTPTNIEFEAEPQQRNGVDTCIIYELSMFAVVGGNPLAFEGLAMDPASQNAGYPTTGQWLITSFIVQNTGNTNSIFSYSAEDLAGVVNGIEFSYFRVNKLSPENPVYPNMTISGGNGLTLDYNVLSTGSSTTSSGLASMVRPVAMNAWFKPTIAPIAQGGSCTIAVVPKGVFESNFLSDSPTLIPGQLQEFTNLDQLTSNACNFRINEGAFAIWSQSGIADYKYRDVVDTQSFLNIDEEQYPTIVLSGVVPPTPGAVPQANTVVNIGLLEVTRVYEVLSASQLISLKSYVGQQAIVDVELQLMADLSLVHENPLHMSDIAAWAAQKGMQVYKFAKRVNNVTQSITGQSVLGLASKALPLLATL